MISAAADSQINHGSHSRQKPCGVRPDESDSHVQRLVMQSLLIPVIQRNFAIVFSTIRQSCLWLVRHGGGVGSCAERKRWHASGMEKVQLETMPLLHGSSIVTKR